MLGIRTCPVNWPIGCGKNFKGVYDRATKKITTFTAAMGGQKEVASQECSLEGDEVNSIIGPDYHRQLMDDIELLDGACDELDMERVAAAEKYDNRHGGSVLSEFQRVCLQDSGKYEQGAPRPYRIYAYLFRQI